MKKRFARIRTSNFSAKPLRKSIATDKRVIVRLGSTTPTEQIFGKMPKVVEINTVDAIQHSRNKLLMKACFKTLNIPQAEWWTSLDHFTHAKDISFPLVVKRVFGFQGKGMQLLNNKEELDSWLKKHDQPFKNGWFFEKFYNYAGEYRLHVAKDIGVIMSWRKLRKEDATERWFFNSHNCNWVSPKHELFSEPKCWAEMCKQAMNALTATGLDIGAVDIRIQSNDSKSPKFIVCEINSAPSLGELGIEIYKENISKLINSKN